MSTASRRRPDLVGLVEVAYASAPSDDLWLTRVLEQAAPSLSNGLGIVGLIYDKIGVHRCVASIETRSQRDVDSVVASGAMGPQDVLERMLLRGPSYASVSSRSGLKADEQDLLFRQVFDPSQGIRDVTGVVTGYPDEPGCVVLAPSAVFCAPRPRETSLWSRVATHLASGLRLRARAPTREPDAVLSPGGKLEHAEGPATPAAVRGALTDAARAMDRARGRLRHRDPEGAVEIWQGLVCGLWSLVDHFDHDGRRFLVARRNTPKVVNAVALDTREHQICALAALGHSNKFIGYELGVPASTVSWHLGRAAKKLGVTSRAELRAAIANRLHRVAPDAGSAAPSR